MSRRLCASSPSPTEVATRLRGGWRAPAASHRLMDGSAVDCYERYAAELTQFAAVLVGPTAAEDVVADAVLRAFSAAGWPDVTAHRAYLYRSVLNQARQLQRSDRRRVWRESAAAR